jgi:hypothetical protein
LPRQLRLPGFQQKKPTGGEVETGRGKKGKKAGWQVTLKLKDIIFAGIGVVGLMMMGFALGVLAGRGDIYRAAYSWGLLNPESARLAQWAPAPGLPAMAPPAAPRIATSPTGASAGAPVPAAAPSPVAAKSKPPSPLTGSIAPLPPAAATKKKAKTGVSRHDLKTREEEMRRVRREVVQKLKFQNSFDTGPKPRLPKSKDHEKARVKSIAAKSPSTQVRVAQYRDSKAAQAKVNELHKKGIKATLKKTKDSKGTLYIVYKPAPPAQLGANKLAQKPKKNSGATRKPKTD